MLSSILTNKQHFSQKNQQNKLILHSTEIAQSNTKTIWDLHIIPLFQKLQMTLTSIQLIGNIVRLSHNPNSIMIQALTIQNVTLSHYRSFQPVSRGALDAKFPCNTNMDYLPLLLALFTGRARHKHIHIQRCI